MDRLPEQSRCHCNCRTPIAKLNCQSHLLNPVNPIGPMATDDKMRLAECMSAFQAAGARPDQVFKSSIFPLLIQLLETATRSVQSLMGAGARPDQMMRGS